MAALPIYNILAVPDSNVYIQTAYYQNMTGRSPVREEKVYLIYLKEEQAREDLTNDSFRKIGLAGVITDVNDDGYIVIRIKNRINVNSVVV